MKLSIVGDDDVDLSWLDFRDLSLIWPRWTPWRRVKFLEEEKRIKERKRRTVEKTNRRRTRRRIWWDLNKRRMNRKKKKEWKSHDNLFSRHFSDVFILTFFLNIKSRNKFKSKKKKTVDMIVKRVSFIKEPNTLLFSCYKGQRLEIEMIIVDDNTNKRKSIVRPSLSWWLFRLVWSICMKGLG